MNSIAQSDNHVPCGYMGMLGCNGYEQIDGIICLIANGDNNFLNCRGFDFVYRHKKQIPTRTTQCV